MWIFNPLTPIRELSGRLEILIRGRLWMQVLIGLLMGMIVGLLLGPDIQLIPSQQSRVIAEWLAIPGYVFLRLIKMVLIPLVVTSIIRGLGATTDPELMHRVGVRFLLFVLFTTLLAIVLGLSLASWIRPGDSVSLANIDSLSSSVPTVLAAAPELHMIPTYVSEIIPDNPLAAMLNTEMLAIVIFSIIIGFAFSQQDNQKVAPLLAFLDGLLAVCMTIVRWSMFLAPWAVFGLIARMVTQVGVATLVGLSVYVLTVLLGLLILMLVYWTIILVFTGRSLLDFIRKMASLQLLAFSTSSSAAVMPLSIQTAEEEFQVDTQIAELLIPLGSTMNMAGTALYQSIAVIFLAQMSGIELSMFELTMVVITLVASSIGAPGTPGIGVIILGSIATNFGIPTTGIILIMGVDRLLDMFRTAINVTGDLTVCLLLAESESSFHRLKMRLGTLFQRLKWS